VAEDSNEAGHMFENSGEQEDENEDDEETPAIGEWYPLSDRLEVRLETEFTLLSLSLISAQYIYIYMITDRTQTP